MEDLGLWKPRLEQRIQEIQQVLDYIHSQPWVVDGVEYDLKRVFIAGHGFGGCTALAVSEREPVRIQYCITLDPWLYCLYKEIVDNEFKIDQPLITISSEEWHQYVPGFDSWSTLKQLFLNNNALEDWLYVIKETAHLFQTDILSLAPLEFKMWTGRNPSNDVVELYELGNKLVMKWVKGFPGFDFIEIKEHT